MRVGAGRTGPDPLMGLRPSPEHPSPVTAQLVMNPRTDDVFVRVATELARQPGMTPEALAAQLRRLYPEVVVRRRGLDGETFETWYVFEMAGGFRPKAQ